MANRKLKALYGMLLALQLGMLPSLLSAQATTQLVSTQPATVPTTMPVIVFGPPDVAAVKLGKDGQPEKRFMQKHESFLQRGKEGDIGVLFLGDSITEGWAKAKDIYQKYYGGYSPANFGISGDRTQHVLWRIDNGELDGIHPKVVVLMIGTNNVQDSADSIAAADKKIADEIHQKLPDTKLLLLGIFPRGADPTNIHDPRMGNIPEIRAKLKDINSQLAKLDDGSKTRYLDIGEKFLDANGVIQKDIMADALHPTVKGYQIWADAMQPLLDEMMK